MTENNFTQRTFLDLNGLKTYDEKIKEVIDTADSALNDAIKAEEAARIADVNTARSEASTAVSNLANGAVAANTGAIQSEIARATGAEEKLDGRLEKVEAFFVTTEDQTLDTALDTLIEIQTYIDTHGDVADEMIKNISANAQAIANEATTREAKDIEIAESLASLGANDEAISALIAKGEGEGAVVIKNSDSAVAEGKGSFAAGNEIRAIGENAYAVGNKTVAGTRGYYWKAIDLTNKKIYITANRVVPSLTENFTDEGFDLAILSGYAVGDKIAIVNNNKYYPEATIASIDGSVITYIGDIGFTAINTVASNDWDIDDYCFYVVAKPEPEAHIEISERICKEVKRNAYAEGTNNTAQGTGAHAEGRDNNAYGDYSHSEGRKTKAAWAAHSEGYETDARGFYSHTEGRHTVTGKDAEGAHAEGRAVKVTGYAAHGEGIGKLNGTIVDDYSEAAGLGSHVEGVYNKALADGAHTEGANNINSGYVTHAEGEGNNISVNQAHVEGQSNTVNGSAHYSHTEGRSNAVNGKTSHTEGSGNTVSSELAHVEGTNNTVSGEKAHVEGESHTVTGSTGHTEGSGNTNKGWASHVEGQANTVETNQSHVEGAGNKALGNAHYAHIEGQNNANVTGKLAHVEGTAHVAVSGETAHVEGMGHTVTGSATHTEGNGNTNKGWASHVEGDKNTVEANQAHAEGGNNTLTNTAHFGHVEGRYNTVSGYAAHASGLGTRATAEAQTAIGKYNAENADALFIVGKGTGDTTDKRSNAFMVDKYGNAHVTGALYIGGVRVEPLGTTTF